MDKKNIIFFLGKGGVGKSTMSSVMSTKLSNSGKKVLIVSLDPAHNLSDIFKKELNNDVHTIRQNLDGMEIDLNVWVKKYLKNARDEIKSNYIYTNAFSLFDKYMDVMKYSPGAEEYAVLWGIEHIYKNYSEKYDYVIFDTPPTGLTVRFLAMPSISRIWIKELSKMREDILNKRHYVLKINPEAGVIQGATDKKDDKVYNKLRGINLELDKMHELFTKKSIMNVVVNPDELSLNETIRIRSELDKIGIKIDSIILNKVTSKHTPIIEKINSNLENYPIFKVELMSKNLNNVSDLENFNIEELINYLNL